MRVILPQSDEISAKIGQGKYKYYRSKETKFQQKSDKESTNITAVKRRNFSKNRTRKVQILQKKRDEISAKIGQEKYKYYHSKETKYKQKSDKESKFHYKYYRSKVLTNESIPKV